MVLFKRKTVTIPPPKYTPEDPNQGVWVIPETLEYFCTYDDYLARLDFYSKKKFICELSGSSCLTFFTARQRELKETENILRRFPEPLKRPILERVHMSTITRLDQLVDELYAWLREHFFVGETVYVRYRDQRINAVVVSAANGVYQVDDSHRILEGDASQLARDRKIVSKLTLRAFVKHSASREQWLGAPWIVRDEYVKRYDLSTEVPPEVQHLFRLHEEEFSDTNSGGEALAGIASSRSLSPTTNKMLEEDDEDEGEDMDSANVGANTLIQTTSGKHAKSQRLSRKRIMRILERIPEAHHFKDDDIFMLARYAADEQLEIHVKNLQTTNPWPMWHKDTRLTTLEAGGKVNHLIEIWLFSRMFQKFLGLSEADTLTFDEFVDALSAHDVPEAIVRLHESILNQLVPEGGLELAFQLPPQLQEKAEKNSKPSSNTSLKRSKRKSEVDAFESIDEDDADERSTGDEIESDDDYVYDREVNESSPKGNRYKNHVEARSRNLRKRRRREEEEDSKSTDEPRTSEKRAREKTDKKSGNQGDETVDNQDMDDNDGVDIPDGEDEEDEDEAEGEVEQEEQTEEEGERSSSSDRKRKKERHWKELIGERQYANGGWQRILADVLSELSYLHAWHAETRAVLEILKPSDAPQSTISAASAYADLQLVHRVHALVMIIRVLYGSPSFRDYLDQQYEHYSSLKRRPLAREIRQLTENLKAVERLISLAKERTSDREVRELEPTATSNDDISDRVKGLTDLPGVPTGDAHGSRISTEDPNIGANESKSDGNELSSKDHVKNDPVESDITSLLQTEAKLREELRSKCDEAEKVNAQIALYDNQRMRLLGKDRFFNRYWWMDANGIGGLKDDCFAMGKLLVQGPSAEDLENCLTSKVYAEEFVAYRKKIYNATQVFKMEHKARLKRQRVAKQEAERNRAVTSSQSEKAATHDAASTSLDKHAYQDNDKIPGASTVEDPATHPGATHRSQSNVKSDDGRLKALKETASVIPRLERTPSPVLSTQQAGSNVEGEGIDDKSLTEQQLRLKQAQEQVQMQAQIAARVQAHFDAEVEAQDVARTHLPGGSQGAPQVPIHLQPPPRPQSQVPPPAQTYQNLQYSQTSLSLPVHPFNNAQIYFPPDQMQWVVQQTSYGPMLYALPVNQYQVLTQQYGLQHVGIPPANIPNSEAYQAYLQQMAMQQAYIAQTQGFPYVPVPSQNNYESQRIPSAGQLPTPQFQPTSSLQPQLPDTQVGIENSSTVVPVNPPEPSQQAKPASLDKETSYSNSKITTSNSTPKARMMRRDEASEDGSQVNNPSYLSKVMNPVSMSARTSTNSGLSSDTKDREVSKKGAESDTQRNITDVTSVKLEFDADGGKQATEPLNTHASGADQLEDQWNESSLSTHVDEPVITPLELLTVFEGDNALLSPNEWRFYETPEEIKHLVRYLRDSGPRESKLIEAIRRNQSRIDSVMTLRLRKMK